MGELNTYIVSPPHPCESVQPPPSPVATSDAVPLCAVPYALPFVEFLLRAPYLETLPGKPRGSNKPTALRSVHTTPQLRCGADT